MLGVRNDAASEFDSRVDRDKAWAGASVEVVVRGRAFKRVLREVLGDVNVQEVD